MKSWIPVTDFDETLLESRHVYRGRVLNLRVDTIRLKSGRETLREIVEHPDCVCAATFLPDRRMVLVRQFRRPTGQALWEVPAGKIDPGEAPDTALLRELVEECGMVPGILEKIVTYYVAPGTCTERMHLYLAHDCVAGEAAPVEDEIIEWNAFTIQEVDHMVREGEIQDAKSLLAILLARESLGRA